MVHPLIRSFLLLVAAWACMRPVWATLMTPGERQHWVFQDSGPLADKPITVYSYRPHSADAHAQVIFVMHGVERDGRRALDNWVPFAEANQLIVVAPEFDARQFPTAWYQWGGMNNPDAPAASFAVIEHLFDRVRSDEGLSTPDYLLFGHSAGAQFVHRFVLTMPGARYATAVAANAGSYTWPGYRAPLAGVRYPWVLDEAHVPPEALKKVFQKKVIILLGEADTRTDSADFPRSREAQQLGANRFERGQGFYAAARDEAARLGVPFQWQLHTVPGVGHHSRDMSKAAAGWLFPSSAAVSSSSSAPPASAASGAPR